MFGNAAARPATGGFGGFGAQPAPVTGGFGGFGAAPAASSATAAPATSGGFGGFGAGGSAWGAKPAAAPAAAATTGWGVPAAAQPSAWGTTLAQQPQQQQQQQQTPQQPQPNFVMLQDFSRQSALASFLMELDKAYDALGPKCRFRTFVYNACPAGELGDVVQRERYVAFLNGGGVPAEEWMLALRHNPDPRHLYPKPLHFAQELGQRCEQQRTELKRLCGLVDGYLTDVEAVAAADEANKGRLLALRQKDVMLRRRWYGLLKKLEVMRRAGIRSGEEDLLRRQAEQLRQRLAAPGLFRDALVSLQPLLHSEAELFAPRVGKNGDGGDGAGLLRAHVDANVMKGWVKFAEQMQDGMQSLHSLLNLDKNDMVAIRERVTQ